MSYRTMTFTAGANSISVNLPGFGYESELHMPIQIEHAEDGSYSFWDNNELGAADYRLCSTASLQLPPAQKSIMNEFFRNSLKGRCETISLALGSDPTGFFPFLPDKGDIGTFTVRLIDRKQSGMLLRPWKWFQDDIVMIMVSSPAYTAAAGIDQGPFRIGDISGLLFPQEGIKPEPSYQFLTELSRSGVPDSVDAPMAADCWSTSFEQNCNTGKAAALITYLRGRRTDDIDIEGPSNFYVYGMDQDDSGTYHSKLLGSSFDENEMVLKVKHEYFNRFTIPLSFWMKEKVVA